MRAYDKGGLTVPNIIQRGLIRMATKAFGLEDLFLSGGDWKAASGSVQAASGVANAYDTSWIAYACIHKQTQDIAGAPLMVLTDPEKSESAVKRGDRLYDLLQRPHQVLTTRQLLQYMVTFLRLRGAFFLDFDDPTRPSAIIPFRDPMAWKAVTDGENLVMWEYRKGATVIRRLPSEVVLGRHIDPANPFGWQSPLQAAANPLAIDREGDSLNAKTIINGGVNGPMFETATSLSDQTYEQLMTRLRQRQNRPGEPLRPLILSNGLKAVDPKFSTNDLRILENQTASAEKICAVYGMTPALLFKDDSPNRETFTTRRKMYWTETLMPIMALIEDALDSWTVPTFGKYVRFDTSSIAALEDDLKNRIDIAKVANSMNIPVAAINEWLDLGLDLDKIPGADDVLVPFSMAPASVVLSEDWIPPAPAPAADPVKAQEQQVQKAAPVWRLTNEQIRSRSLDAVAVIARGKARAALEKRLERSWRAEMSRQKVAAVKAVAAAGERVEGVIAALDKLRAPMAEALIEVATPVHRDAAVEGALSIIDATSQQRFYGTEREGIFRKAPVLPAEAVDTIRARQNYIKGMADDLFNDIMAGVEDAVVQTDGPTAQVIASVVKSKFNVAINRAAMIGRTEVGTAFNSSRFGQMKAQGLGKHEWMTAGDELVRGSDPKDAFSHISSDGSTVTIGESFPSGLRYPQEDGGDPGNVINCRCLTIPVVEE